MGTTFEGKVALVTGGGSGIGRATAEAFAREGAKVVVADLMTEGGEETVELIGKAGGIATFLRTDVSKSADVAAMVNRVVEVYGRLDCAHNNAGVEGSPRDWTDEAAWDRTIEINLKGVFLCLKYEIPQMLKQGGGAIVNTASVAGLVGIVGGVAPYQASKHGVVGLTKWAGLTFAKQGIRVNAVCPGAIETPMAVRARDGAPPKSSSAIAVTQPIGRYGNPQEIAEAVLWLCSPAASFVTAHAMPVDGGWTAQ